MVTVQVSKMGMISFLRELRVEWGDTHTRVGGHEGHAQRATITFTGGLRVDKEGLSEGWHLTSGLKDR